MTLKHRLPKICKINEFLQQLKIEFDFIGHTYYSELTKYMDLNLLIYSCIILGADNFLFYTVSSKGSNRHFQIFKQTFKNIILDLVESTHH